MTTNIELTEVTVNKKTVLRQLIELYEYDLSPYTGNKVNKHGYFEYLYLDSYWTQNQRFAYFILIDEALAGFVMVNDYCEVSREASTKAIAEFFVMRQFRRQGIGREIAEKVFRLFPGPWEVHQYLQNKQSITFWEKVIGDYTFNNFVKQITDDGERQVILFNSTERN